MHLAWRWFTGLGFDQEIPHHSTFSKNRHGRFQDSKIFEQLFEEVVARCLAVGLVCGDKLSVDGTFVEANAPKESRIPREQLAEVAQVNRTVREYLAELEVDGWMKGRDCLSARCVVWLRMKTAIFAPSSLPTKTRFRLSDPAGYSGNSSPGDTRRRVCSSHWRQKYPRRKAGRNCGSSFRMGSSFGLSTESSQGPRRQP